MESTPSELNDPLAPSYVQVITAVLGAGVFVTSTVIGWASLDTFRVPKEIAFRAEAVLLAVLLVFAATATSGGWRRLREGLSRVEIALPLCILAWTVVATLTSTNRPLSVESLVTVAASVIIFFATRRVAPHLPLLALDVLLGVASINAIFVTVQEYGGWNPFFFPPEVTQHIKSTALIGNPNDVGSYLAGPTIAAIVALVAVPGRRRILYALATIILTVGLIASGTRTAMIAITCGVVVLALSRSLRQSLITLLILLLVLGVTLRPSTTLGRRARELVSAAKERRYDTLFSDRLPPFLSALDMLRARPLTGEGPGTFKYHFMEARLGLERHYPAAWLRGWPMSFGETHNDHLQTAAETGLPGYLLFLTAIGVTAFRRRKDLTAAPGTAHFAHVLHMPLAATFFVLALAQFPLQLAAPRLLFLTLAALSLGWEPRRA